MNENTEIKLTDEELAQVTGGSILNTSDLLPLDRNKSNNDIKNMFRQMSDLGADSLDVVDVLQFIAQ